MTGFLFLSNIAVSLLSSSSVWWEYNIHEWHHLLSWTPSRVSTLPGLHVDGQGTPWLWHLHKFLCYQYRANLRLHHCVVSCHLFLCTVLFINHQLKAHMKHTLFSVHSSARHALPSIHFLKWFFNLKDGGGPVPAELGGEEGYLPDRLPVCHKANSDRQTIIHAHIHIEGQFTFISQLNMHVFVLWIEVAAEKRACRLHRETSQPSGLSHSF